ncbi:unnamed protein product [Danaus chrysippus]|uniref:(African queen) hypothetical protein n=1 Tax=Danaus chrysippus TaxID=151541 RepID=A0A8J2QDJ1_9NEOP|nr:unnamed protein product [Danaus chrysippus]
MVAVFTFTRSDNDILQELMRVFSTGRCTAREQWSMQAELIVEPLGWDALWKLSKDFCKKFEVRYPCVAYITVTLVNFEDISANVDVLSVQHEAVTLPESIVNVPLIELWPTIKQREQCVNAASTAEFIDIMRFFYDNIWMPWDDQDDKILLPNTIEDRMNLWMELHNGTIPNYIARSITLLRTSAINAHQKLQELDSSLCEGDFADDDDSLLPPNYISLCAELNARLDGLISKWTLYENPLIREQYLAKTMKKCQRNKSKKNVVALWQGGDIAEFKNITRFLETRLTNDHTLTITMSAEEALSLEPNEVVVCSKQYEIPEVSLSQITLCSIDGAMLKASDMRSCLLMLNDECHIQDMTLHCSSVNTVIVMLSGTLHVKNCMLLDDSSNFQSDFAQGIVAMSGAKVILEDCTFENFYSGIVIHKGAQMELRNCLIEKCGVGIQIYSGAQVKLDGVIIEECTEQCIRCEMENGIVKTEMDGLEMINCKIGSGNLQKEIYVTQDVNM